MTWLAAVLLFAAAAVVWVVVSGRHTERYTAGAQQPGDTAQLARGLFGVGGCFIDIVLLVAGAVTVWLLWQ